MSNPVSHFVDLLDNWAYHYPLPSQWAVEIPLPSGIDQSLQDKLQELEHPEWEFGAALSELTKHEVIKKDGVFCFFVDGANLQGENYGTGVVDIGESGSINGGLIPGLISNGRGNFASREVSIRFRESAYSFADFIIRPWVILASHLGRIADQNDQIKTNVTVYNYGKAESGSTPKIRKVYRYYGCVPAKVEAQELKYSEDSSIMTYSTGWFFDRYSLSTR